jgi:hypothetical protein
VPNYLAVGADGTVYVTEWTFFAPDPNEGLYIYPPTGPERFTNDNITAPNGIDLDAAGNVYVVNNNTEYSTGMASLDTAHVIAVLSPGGGTFLKSIVVPAEPYPITVAADGTAWISDFPIPALSVTGGTYLAKPNQYSGTEISTHAAADVVLWNGSVETLSTNRRGAASTTGAGSAHAGGFAMRHHR